mmetsp:Transcript_1788/g.5199  ORF Transcript_1788/g.5199 Transcript_1788/m.5199 type:complete len:522 (-) Transcript_1788:1671-3236(-)
MGNTFPRPVDDLFEVCTEFHDPNGSLFWQYLGRGLQWLTFILSWSQLAFYGYQSFRTTMGWEETYVCVIEAFKITLDIFFMYSTPATIYQSNGNTVSWLTYSEWLLTCPVILVQLCNITGLEADFNDRTMQVLISDVGAIVFGTYAAFSSGWLKMVFFLIGCCYGSFTFYHAAKIYIESFYIVPKGTCRFLVKYMAWCFFISWVGFPVIFLAGPDGFGHISIWAEVVGQQICELLAKNVWGLFGHILRIKIHEHIVQYGDVRAPKKLKFGGKSLMVMGWVENDCEDTIRVSTQKMVQRNESLTKVRDNMKKRGLNTRQSMDFDRDLSLPELVLAPGMPPEYKQKIHFDMESPPVQQEAKAFPMPTPQHQQQLMMMLMQMQQQGWFHMQAPQPSGAMQPFQASSSSAGTLQPFQMGYGQAATQAEANVGGQSSPAPPAQMYPAAAVAPLSTEKLNSMAEIQGDVQPASGCSSHRSAASRSASTPADRLPGKTEMRDELCKTLKKVEDELQNGTVGTVKESMI